MLPLIKINLIIYLFTSPPFDPLFAWLPLPQFPEPCPYRQVVLAQQAQAAIAPMAASQLTPGLVALKPKQGLPPLPDVAFMLFTSPTGDQQMLGALADQIVECCMTQQREMAAPA